MPCFYSVNGYCVLQVNTNYNWHHRRVKHRVRKWFTLIISETLRALVLDSVLSFSKYAQSNVYLIIDCYSVILNTPDYS